MKVLHITTIDAGGAYKAAYRLHENMKLHGVDSQILVRTKTNAESQVVETFHNPVEALMSKGKNAINLLLAKGNIANDRFGTDVSKHEMVKQADVIILHWVNSFLSKRDILKLGKLGKKIIWVMHDMWLFTGGCHVDGYCAGYEKMCGNCPLIKNKKENDLSRKNFLSKKEMMQNLDVTITGPSEWIVREAAKSDILQGKKIYHIPNVLDTTFYKPVEDKEALKRKYGISSQKKVVLFGAADNGTENANKGFGYLKDAFSYLPTSKYCLVIFGNAGENLGLPNELEVVKVGYISEESKLVELYNLADVLVNPSSQESFGYTVCEAMACGTPAVGFPIGGIKEQIEHKLNGYLACYHDAEDLARGIEYCVENARKLGIEAYHAAQRYSYSQEWYRRII